MKEGLTIHRCESCRAMYFPLRLLCPRCGADRLIPEDVFDGVVEETTLVRQARGRPDWIPRPIGTVRVAGELAVIAGLDEQFAQGAAVRLFMNEGAPLAKRPT